MLIEFRISIYIIMFLSAFEVIVLLLDGKVMTFVLYPLIKFQEIVKIGMQQIHLRLKVLLCDKC